MAEVPPLVRGVDAHARVELDAGRRADPQRRRPLLERCEVERLLAGEAERLDRLAVRELQRQHAHADEVGAVDALVGPGEDEPDAEQVRALGGPVARRARAVLLAGQHAQRHALFGGGHRRLVDRRLLAVPDRQAALGAWRELVAQADVGERAAHHHLVVAAPGAVGVEVAPLDAVLEQVAPGGRVARDRAGGRDVVGRDAVAQATRSPVRR